MLGQVFYNNTGQNDILTIANASVAGYFILNGNGHLCQSSGLVDDIHGNDNSMLDRFPMIQYHLHNPNASGAFYRLSDKTFLSGSDEDQKSVYIGSLPHEDKLLGIVFKGILLNVEVEHMKSEIFILSLITQALRAFNRANDLENILKIVLIGVTAGSGLGFNRAFVLLTQDEQNCLKGALANGPSSPEEAGHIWQKLSSGELTLDKMFEESLRKNEKEKPLLENIIEDLVIPLDNKDNIFARSALENKSMIINEMTLAGSEYSELHSKIGPGPIAVVPLVGNEYLQGVLIADNFITCKEITENDLYLLEIFAKYASDSIEKFRLYKRLAKKVEALKEANRMIISNRENVIKAEKLSVLADMAEQVAHEIRNPLTVVGGFTKLMLKKTTAEDENYEDLKMIIDQVSRIEQALEKFTSLMNYQNKDDRVCDLGELVKSTLAMNLPGIDFSKFEVQYERPVMIKIDPDLFRQALFIVLKRATAIQQNQEHILLSIERFNDKISVNFKSISHDSSLVNDLYDSFSSWQSHKKFKELSTSIEILKFYGGNIGLKASSNEESSFYLELPVYEEV